jgi:two-component sensor histidine kinase
VAEGTDARAQAEVRHRLANVFQLLSTLARMRLRRTDDPESGRHLGWMLEMIEATAALQQRLLSDGGDDFALFLADMAPRWRRRCAGRPIAIELDAEPLRTLESRASALALIANELVLNAIAHAFPDDRDGVVRIEFRRVAEGRAVLAVADDGRGYDPADVSPDRLGLWLVAGLAAQVKGELTTETENGVRCRLEFPL